jgi:hypothetical protein
MACLFFDQINNNANFGVLHPLLTGPSTDLSTVIVDKARSRCQTKTYTYSSPDPHPPAAKPGGGNASLVWPGAAAYDSRPQGVGPLILDFLPAV